ncbi:MAG: NERD domain-containing protein [Anaerolineales bacterium]|nr:NERD domain-containing protein [Anaerolineales bacterium]
MYPERLRTETLSNAEKELYRRFATQLPAEFHVFHSVSWQVPDVRYGASDGEADFLLAHPNLGIMVIEVKGGLIRYDGLQAHWYSGSASIKDPFDQAKNNKYSLQKLLKGDPYFSSRWLSMGHAVAFPDVDVKGSLRLDAPREIILDASDMANVLAWVQAAFAHWHGQTEAISTLGEAGLQAIARILSPSWELRLSLATIIQEDETEIRRLTEDQFHILDLLGRTRRAAVSGCAGSGKTTLAVEKAIRLGKQGAHVLLTCYNRHLADNLANGLADIPGVEVASFHAIALEWCRQAGLLIGPAPSDQAFFEDRLPDLLMGAIDKLGPKFDAVIVDEGQDFREHWWVPLQSFLRDTMNGFLFVFYDDNQKLYSGGGIPTEFLPFPLSRNLRNTQQVHKMVMNYYRSGTIPAALGPIGRPVEVHAYADGDALKQLLRQALHRLVSQENVSPEDIVVLTPRAAARSVLWRFGSLGNFRLTDKWAAGGADIYCTTVHSFKGLESPVVILAEIDEQAALDLETILYVGCSRAVSHLIVLAESNTAEAIAGLKAADQAPGAGSN